MKIRSLRERGLVSALRQEFRGSWGGVFVGIGDDAAVVRKARGRGLLTTDLLIEDVHFKTAIHPPFLLGRKALNVNLSDIAAMGGRPLFALLGLGLRSGVGKRWVEEFCVGFKKALAEAGVALVGGDISAAKKICLAVTIFGESEHVVLRSGARPGDLIFVSGRLGEAAAGWRLLRKGYRLGTSKRLDPLLKAFLDPRPQIALGRVLARRRLASAMIDTSDGLSVDLHHLCEESGTGAVVELAALPISPLLRRIENNPFALALHGGEDYQLLFAAPAANRSKIMRLAPKFGLTEIGRVVKGKRIQIIDGRGRKKLLPIKGYEHFAS